MLGRTARSILCLLLCTPAFAQTAGLLVSTARDTATASGRLADIRDEDLLCLRPGLSAEVAPFFHRQNWEALVGDADGDGSFDDPPGEVDALQVAPGTTGRPQIGQVWVSFSADTLFPSGRRALDGDLIRLVPGSDFQVTVPEATFEVWTGCTNVDVDGYAEDAAGERWFTFADDETTVDATLIAQNGGSALLDKHVVFRVRPGANRAEIAWSKTQIVTLAGNALGRVLTTVVNTMELEIDPSSPGDVMFTTGSTAAGIIGTVFTTRSGGQIAVLNGMPLSGAGVFGFATAETLDGLALTSDFTAPASVLLANDQVTVPPAEPIRVRFLGGPAGGAGHVFVSNARLPALAPTALPAPFTGTGLAWVDLWDPMLVWSAIMPSFTLPLDASGDGELLFGATQISLGLRIVVQGVVVPGFAVTEPVVLETN